MKTNELKQIIIAIEDNAKKSNITEIEQLFAQFLQEYPLKELFIDKELAKLKKS
jgi:hypothetical protein